MIKEWEKLCRDNSIGSIYDWSGYTEVVPSIQSNDFWTKMGYIKEVEEYKKKIGEPIQHERKKPIHINIYISKNLLKEFNK